MKVRLNPFRARIITPDTHFKQFCPQKGLPTGKAFIGREPITTPLNFHEHLDHGRRPSLLEHVKHHLAVHDLPNCCLTGRGWPLNRPGSFNTSFRRGKTPSHAAEPLVSPCRPRAPQMVGVRVGDGVGLGLCRRVG